MPNWIGDLVMALSVVRTKNENTSEALELLVPEGMTALTAALTHHPLVAYRRGTGEAIRRTLGEVRQRSYDRIYLLPFSFSSAWFAFRARIPERRGINKDGRGFLLTDRLPGSTRDVTQHITQEYAKILDTAPLAPELLAGTRLVPDPTYHGKVIFCPGARYGPTKRWGGFAALASALSDEEIVVLGSSAEAEAASEVTQSAPERITNLAGKTTAVEAAHIIAGARLVVSNDSGLMHLAAYLGAPTLGLFGSTSPVWTRPIGPTAHVIHSDITCSPCFKRHCRFGHYRCLAALTVDRVAEECMSLLSGRSQKVHQSQADTYRDEVG